MHARVTKAGHHARRLRPAWNWNPDPPHGLIGLREWRPTENSAIHFEATSYGVADEAALFVENESSVAGQPQTIRFSLMLDQDLARALEELTGGDTHGPFGGRGVLRLGRLRRGRAIGIGHRVPRSGQMLLESTGWPAT